jgi:ABC-2 type transport system ATP-binding protein
MTVTDHAIHVDGLRKTYDSVAALDGVDLQVPHGEIFALLGPNGAGKTTTIEILEGYRRRDSGEVQVLGTDPERSTPAWRARIGVVLQSTAEADQLSVDELIKHFALYYPNPRDPGEVRDLVGLTDKAATRVHKLSGALAAHDPPVVVRIERRAVMVDLRTVDPADDDLVATKVAEALGGPSR